jgi:hypothetical protein
MVGIDSRWQRLSYGSDLRICVGSWDNPITMGSGVGTLRWRRFGPFFYFDLTFGLGASTVLPAPLPGFDNRLQFELPGFVHTATGDGTLPTPTSMRGVAYAIDDDGVGSDVGMWSIANRTSGSDTRPGLLAYFPNGGAGLMTRTFPFTFEADDSFGASGLCAAVET